MVLLTHGCARSKMLVLALSFALMSPFARAADLLEIYQLALQKDPTLRGAVAQNLAAAQDKPIALSDYLPKIELGLEQSETVQDVLSTENVVFTSGKVNYPTTSYTATLSQTIVNLGTISNIKRSDATIDAANAELEAARQDLVLRTAEVYFEVLAAIDERDYIRAEKAAVEPNLELVKTQAKAGLARKTDLLDALARHASVLSSEAEAEKGVYDAQLALEEIIGSRPAELDGLLDQFELSRPVPDTPQAWVDAGMQANPAVIAGQAQVEAAEHEVKRLYGGHLPTLDFTARYDRNDARGSLFGGASDVENVIYAFQLRVPLLAGGRVYAEVKQAAQLLVQSQSELDRAQREVQRQTEMSFRGIDSAIVRVGAMGKAVEAQQLAREAKNESYKAGLLTLMSVLDADRDLYIARRDLARAKYDFIVESLRLERAAGTLDENDVQRINAWLQ